MKSKTITYIAIVVLFFSTCCSGIYAIERGPFTPVTPEGELVKGAQWLFVIGINDYKHWKKLDAAVKDATDLRDLLMEKYYFDKEHLIELYDPNATKTNIIAKLRYLGQVVKPEDSLVIYYAGHGFLDSLTKTASWIPVDGKKDDTTTWIDSYKIRMLLNKNVIKARHILLISDSCFSGDLLRGDDDFPIKITNEVLKRAYRSTSRRVITSGGVEPVSDSGYGGNSVFTHFLLKALQANNEKFLLPSAFKTDLTKNVSDNSSQVPQFGTILGTGGEQSGEIVLFARPGFNIKRPGKKKFDIGDLEEEADKITELKLSWDNDLNEMKRAYSQVVKFQERSIPNDRKIRSWQRFLKTFTEDNPFTGEDEKMRREANLRIKTLQNESSRLAYGKKEETPIHNKQAEEYRDPVTGMEFVLVPGDCYKMGDQFGEGSNDEKPVHEVCLDDFYIGKYEVTQGEWKSLMGDNPSKFENGDDYPVEQVSWDDAQKFIKRLNKKGDGKYRLPTEAEWEFAARSGGKKQKWAGTSKESELGKYGWYGTNSGSKTHPVGKKIANGIGLFDMTGNVYEWCSDWYSKDYYKKSPKDNPLGPSSGSDRVFRGGSWNGNPRYVRAADRSRGTPGGRSDGLGFRLARTP